MAQVLGLSAVAASTPPSPYVSSVNMTVTVAVFAGLFMFLVCSCMCVSARRQRAAASQQDSEKEGSRSGRYGLKDWNLKRVVLVVHPDNTPICAQRSDLAKRTAAGAMSDEAKGPAPSSPAPAPGPAGGRSVTPALAGVRNVLDDGPTRKATPPMITVDVSWHGLPVVRNLLSANSGSGGLSSSPPALHALAQMGRQASAALTLRDSSQHGEKPD